jgi:hypothetical protein
MQQDTQQDRSILRELWAALLGTVITTGLQLLFLLRPGAELDWRSLALAAITGAVIGWGYRLGTDLRNASRKALTDLGNLVNQASARLQRTTEALDVQQETINMLLSAKIHKEAIWKLVSASLEGDKKSLAYVSRNRYLGYLRTTISASNKSTGVKRAPIRSYKLNDDNVMETYLHTLRDKPMKKKTRVFIIDSEHEQDMKEDLENPELMNYYWKESGEDVESYWITTPEFRQNFSQSDVPNEFAIYDDELLIAYDEPLRTLVFGIVNEAEDRLKIFEALVEQQSNDSQRPFRKIVSPTGHG